MTSAEFRTTDYVIAGIVTVLGHVLVFLLFVGLAVLQVFSPAKPQASPSPSPEVMVEITPELFQRPAPPKEEAPVDRNRYVRTLASQEAQDEAIDTNLIGEYNTKASGNLLPDPEAPKQPSLDGAEARQPREINTFDSSFQDGPSPVPQPQQTVVEEQVAGEDQAPTPEKSLAVQETSPQEEQLPSEAEEESLVTENRVPVPDLDGPGEEKREETLPREKPSEPDPQTVDRPGGDSKVAEKIKDPVVKQSPGFQGEVRKTRLRGSIGRNGETSAEVKNTPLGRYQALLSRAVEREWQKNCIRYRDHITPGLLTIRFFVNEKGRVSGFRFLDVVEAGEIQKGFTLNSIKTAPIPKMPPVLEKDLDGEPLELIYNFYF